jgi:hypothetical protein
VIRLRHIAPQKKVRVQPQKRPHDGRLFAQRAIRKEEIPPTLKSSDATPHALVVMSRHRT